MELCQHTWLLYKIKAENYLHTCRQNSARQFYFHRDTVTFISDNIMWTKLLVTLVCRQNYEYASNDLIQNYKKLKIKKFH
jgi:hypothetical protein